MEMEKKNVSAEEKKQEIIKLITTNHAQTPDAEVMLKEFLEKTDRMEAGEIPINIQRIDQLKLAYILAKKYTSGINVSVCLYENCPFAGMGSVQIEGKNIQFTNTEWFARMAEFADNSEVYPLTTGYVRVVFTFHGLSHE